ncbi:MAG: cytochrome c [Hyphomicrobiaceae bacterium]
MPARPPSRRGACLIVALLWGIAAVSSVAAPATAGDIAYGEYLSAECATCHRSDGVNEGIPSIVGWPPDRFIAILKSYKTKERSNLTMQTVAGRLNDEDIAALAAYYATLKPH